jgi:hypothetical protein
VNGLHRMQRLLNIPTKENDNTAVLQAISKLIYDKLRPEIIQQQQLGNNNTNLNNEDNNKNSVQISLGSVNLGFDTSGIKRVAKIQLSLIINLISFF